MCQYKSLKILEHQKCEKVIHTTFWLKFVLSQPPNVEMWHLVIDDFMELCITLFDGFIGSFTIYNITVKTLWKTKVIHIIRV
jgi:hypothetical protein